MRAEGKYEPLILPEFIGPGRRLQLGHASLLRIVYSAINAGSVTHGAPLSKAMSETTEWRVFIGNSSYSPTPDLQDASSTPPRPLPDIWRILDIRPRRSPQPVRTDVYVPCSPRSGVKLRYGQQLELKLRLERYENGAEKWLKPPVIHQYFTEPNIHGLFSRRWRTCSILMIIKISKV